MYICVIFHVPVVNLNSDNTDYGYMHVDTISNTLLPTIINQIYLPLLPNNFKLSMVAGV